MRLLFIHEAGIAGGRDMQQCPLCLDRHGAPSYTEKSFKGGGRVLA